MTPPANPTSLTPVMRDAFWQAVEDCLVEFHSKSPRDATYEAAKLRRDLENSPPDIDGDIIYHSEPFYVACDIAGLHDPREQDRLLGNNRVKYDSILKIRGW
jgi:hypothetical protein